MKKIILSQDHSTDTVAQKSKFLKRILPFLIVVGVLVILSFLYSLFSGPGSMVNFIFNIGTSLKNTDNRVNVLLLGNAGGFHDGATLTDTIMVASINLKTDQTYLISLPRDFWIEGTKHKLNAAYDAGEKKGGGLSFTKQVVGDILGIPIHYGIRLDFGGFEKAVDLVDGVEVEVDKSFQDFLYPLTGKEKDLCGFKEEEKEFNGEEAKALNIAPGKRKVFIAPDGKIATDSAEEDKGVKYFSCRYEHIEFKKGLTHMDGEMALKFVRSRHGTNGEGSDFARSKRQQKVMESFRKKVLSFEVLANPSKISQLTQEFGNSFETDIPATNILEFYKFSKKMSGSQNIVIDDSKDLGLLINPPYKDYDGAYVLVPKDGNYIEIHEYVKKALEGGLNNEATGSARPRSN